MNLLFNSTKKFEKDLKKFSVTDQKKIISKINFYSSNGESLFHQNAYRPIKLILPDDDGSSLYVIKISKDIRVILTFEDDPIFDQTVVTLFRVVRHNSLEKAFKGIAESLYQNKVNFQYGEKNG